MRHLAISLAIIGAAAGAANAEPLEHLRWQQRLLLVFSPGGDDARALAFEAVLESRACEVRERDLAVARIPAGTPATVDGDTLSEDESRTIRAAYQVPDGTFAVILVGKDGGEKARVGEVPNLDDLFALIDSMPMRRAEMRTRGAPCES